jgi:hypothetical protein
MASRCGYSHFPSTTVRSAASPGSRQSDGCSRGSAKNWKRNRAATASFPAEAPCRTAVLQSFSNRDGRAAMDRTHCPLPAACSGSGERGPGAAPFDGACRRKRCVALSRQPACQPLTRARSGQIEAQECPFCVQFSRRPRPSRVSTVCAARPARPESACAHSCPSRNFIHQPHPTRAPTAFRQPEKAHGLRPAACQAGAPRNSIDVQ